MRICCLENGVPRSLSVDEVVARAKKSVSLWIWYTSYYRYSIGEVDRRGKLHGKIGRALLELMSELHSRRLSPVLPEDLGISKQALVARVSRLRSIVFEDLKVIEAVFVPSHTGVVSAYQLLPKFTRLLVVGTDPPGREKDVDWSRLEI